MNSKTTRIWFALAAALFAFIYIFQHFFNKAEALNGIIISGLQPQSVTSVQIIPAVPVEIRADRVNGSWLLSKPFTYPAQTAAIDTLLTTLQKLKPATKITSSELREHTNYESEFGFDNPQYSIVITAGDQRWQLLVGKRTAPGDQVFMRVVGLDGVYVTDADWLKLIPQSANNWRSTSLVNSAKGDFDSIILTNDAIVIELHRNPTNQLWRMTRPLQARADNERITDALQHLMSAGISQFITDDPKADLSTYGLQPDDLDLWLGHGTNFTTGIHLGKPLTNDPTQVYAKLDGLNTVVATTRQTFSPWQGSVNDFRDPHLLELTAPVAEIIVQSEGTNTVTLQSQGTNGWKVVGEKFPVDVATVVQLVKNLADMRVSEFVLAMASPTDLAARGFNSPQRQVTLRSVVGDTNSVIAQLAFAVQTNTVYVHRSDEDFIYAIKPEDFNRIQESGWEFRDRSIWDFKPSDIAQITIHQDGKTRVMTHEGLNKWELAAGSQGIINGKFIEDTATALGNISAFSWVGRNLPDADKYGFHTNSLQVVFEMKNGEKHEVDFGQEFSQWQSALAAVTLDGERWTFLFPPGLYQFVLSYLTIPANVP